MAELIFILHVILTLRPPPEQESDYTIHNRCCMHMLWSTITDMLRLFHVANPLFCGTALMHRSGNRTVIKKLVNKIIQTRLKIVYQAPPEHPYNAKLLELFEAAFDPDGVRFLVYPGFLFAIWHLRFETAGVSIAIAARVAFAIALAIACWPLRFEIVAFACQS